MKKDDIISLRIEDLSSEGLGIGHTKEGMAVFVKDTVIGDSIQARILKLKKNYAFGRWEKLLAPSRDRCAAPCPVARCCGGCQLQMMSYQAQLDFKQKKVRDCLERIGGLTEPKAEKIIGMEDPFRYRNKSQFPVGQARDGHLIAGFYAGRTHSIIDCRDCLLGVEENREVLETVLTHMERHQIPAYDEISGTGLVRHVMTRSARATGQMMVCLVVNGKSLPKEEELCASLSGIRGMTSVVLNENSERTNVILGEKTRTLWGQAVIEDRIGAVCYQISARSFYQVNPLQTLKLYEKVMEFADLKGQETVWDLYCGIGTISLFLAQKAGKVYGVEVIPQAVADAQKNAALNGFKNTEFFSGRAEEVFPEQCARQKRKADVIVIDPPRKGCDGKVLAAMLTMAPDRIVYVSCDPATLARDLKVLTDGGYEVKGIQPVDMFPHTVHVETVALLTRTN